MPKILSTTVEFILNTDLHHLLETEEYDLQALEKLAAEINKWSFKRDKTTLSFIASKTIIRLMEKLAKTPKNIEWLERIVKTLDILHALTLDLDIWEVQNIYHAIDERLYSSMQAQAEKDNPKVKKWIELFDRLGVGLHVARG